MSLSWKDYPRKKDRIALVGFAPVTREIVPWDDPDLEIFSLNEGYNFSWLKRWDRWFQIHPRWDFIRNSNNNDPNHFLWLKNQEGKCIQCLGTGKVIPIGVKGSEKQIDCPACKGTGHYKPPESRSADFPIYMQQAHDDIPGSVAFPLDEIIKAIIPEENRQKDYFTSSCAQMLGLAYLMGYKQIELYGFEMGAETEFHYQRANFEYICGLLQGKGIKIIVPPESPLLTGPLYAYKNMKQGYRQNLEMRKNFLKNKLLQNNEGGMKIQGQIELLKSLDLSKPIDIKALLANAESDKAMVLSLSNGLQFAISEVQNLTKMYDDYFWAGENGEDADNLMVPDRAANKFVVVNYKVKNV